MKSTLLLFCLLLALPVWARGAGIAASGCQGCHGQTAHAVTLDVTPTPVMPGGTATVTVTLRGSGSNAGLYLTATRGTFSVLSGQNTRLLNGDVVQSSPKGVSGGQATFQVQWTAPAMAGGAELSAFTVLGNGDGRSGGDSTGEARRQLVFGCAGTTYYRDFDGDGAGSASNGTSLDCSTPQGFSTRDGDCDDFNATVVPGGTERCNAKDDDCDGMVDEGLSNVSTWPDVDGDGYGDRRGAMATGCSSSGRAPNDLDCDDRDPNVHPGVKETCNLKDDDCNGRSDDGVRVRCGTGWCEALGITCDPLSCQPGRPLTERCNLLDDDCDGQVDEGTLCAAGQACVRGACVVTDVEAPEADAGVAPPDPMTMTPAPTPPPASCATVTGLLPLAALALLRRRGRASAKTSSHGPEPRA
ncbi:MAG: hypothetical protein JNJ54_36485 [Myxococcaceae bacterium]|nr:hypothetical protein [Myxococcaceae bacterium]